MAARTDPDLDAVDQRPSVDQGLLMENSIDDHTARTPTCREGSRFT